MKTKSNSPEAIATDNTPTATLSTCSTNCECHSVNRENLCDRITNALTSSSELETAVLSLNKTVGTINRLQQELAAFRERETELSESIQNLKRSFGERDSQKDLDRLTELEITLKATRDAIPILEERINNDNELKKNMAEQKEAVLGFLILALEDTREYMQAAIDRQVKHLCITLNEYMEAFYLAAHIQEVVPRSEFSPGQLHERFAPRLDVLEDMFDSQYSSLFLKKTVKRIAEESTS